MTTTIQTETNGPATDQASMSLTMLKNRISELQAELHSKERDQGYSKVVRTIKDLIELTVPRHSIILAISKGDEDLLELRGRYGWHFPRAVNGKFAGCYPANSDEAITHLESLRSQGAAYLLIPSTAFWWLEFYTDFTNHLQQHYRIVTYHEAACIIYRLR